jgi:SAM-dependent methyltransferase
MSNQRTMRQIRQHYEVETELAERLRNTPKSERARAYGEIYSELMRRVPDHPSMMRAADPDYSAAVARERYVLLRAYLQPETVFLEIGAGDCRLSLQVAETVKQVYALEVSREITKYAASRPNFEIVISNGTDIPVPPGSIDLAFSFQVMEHIHPEDAREQLGNVLLALAPGGVYMCVTPNRLSGPHDVSQYFDDTARGLHLKEYSVAETAELFRHAGFGRVTAMAGTLGHFIELPIWTIAIVESLVEKLPARIRKRMVGLPGLRHLLSAAVIGRR